MNLSTNNSIDSFVLVNLSLLSRTATTTPPPLPPPSPAPAPLLLPLLPPLPLHYNLRTKAPCNTANTISKIIETTTVATTFLAMLLPVKLKPYYTYDAFNTFTTTLTTARRLLLLLLLLLTSYPASNDTCQIRAAQLPVAQAPIAVTAAEVAGTQAPKLLQQLRMQTRQGRTQEC